MVAGRTSDSVDDSTLSSLALYKGGYLRRGSKKDIKKEKMFNWHNTQETLLCRIQNR